VIQYKFTQSNRGYDPHNQSLANSLSLQEASQWFSSTVTSMMCCTTLEARHTVSQHSLHQSAAVILLNQQGYSLMLKLLTLFTQFCCVITLFLVLLADHYFKQGGLLIYVLLPVATFFMALPHLVEHYFIELVDDEEEELSCIRLKQP
jgi:hypothetical protein